jgi:hypothetical protein
MEIPHGLRPEDDGCMEILHGLRPGDDGCMEIPGIRPGERRQSVGDPHGLWPGDDVA